MLRYGQFGKKMVKQVMKPMDQTGEDYKLLIHSNFSWKWEFVPPLSELGF